VSYHNVWRIAFIMAAAGAYLQTQTGSDLWGWLTLAGLALCIWNRFRPIQDREDL
jgi:hypothetical protein